MKRLEYKICPTCGGKIFGIKREDRNSYRYPPRCDNCPKRMPLTEEQKDNIRAGLAKTREDNLLPIGSTRLHNTGRGVYRLIKTGQPNQWEYEHRVVANAPDGMLVHHVNGDRLDNRPENLQVIGLSDHQKHHQNLNGKWSIQHTACLGCGTTERRHISRGLCSRCYQRPEFQDSGEYTYRV